MSSSPSPPPPSKRPLPTRLLTRIIHSSPLGFTHFPNFLLFFIFGGALLGFTLARLPYLSFSYFCPQTLDCYHYTPKSVDKVGIILHLAAILPASFLAVFQFIPIIRHKVILFHRINGYLILWLSVISIIGAALMGSSIMGGDISAQSVLGVVGVMFLVSMGLAWWNIRKLQIEQHRAWMLRAWFYAGSIISMRLIMMIMIRIVTKPSSSRSVAMPCAKIAYYFGGSPEATLSRYPDCSSYFSGEDLNKFSAVKGDLHGDFAEFTALYNSIFGSAMLVALVVHAIGVEVYLRLTPAEANRLRNVSYQRQLEAGKKNPGRMGLTADRLGYAVEWVPSTGS